MVLRTRHRTRCCSQAIVGQTRRQLNNLGGGVGEGGGGASIRQGAFMPSRLTVRFDTKEFALKPDG